MFLDSTHPQLSKISLVAHRKAYQEEAKSLSSDAPDFRSYFLDVLSEKSNGHAEWEKPLSHSDLAWALRQVTKKHALTQEVGKSVVTLPRFSGHRQIET